MTRKIVLDVDTSDKTLVSKSACNGKPVQAPGKKDVEKGPALTPPNPESNTSKRLEWLKSNRHPDRPYDDPGETLFTAPRGKGLRLRLFKHARGFLELRIERRVKGEWWWTEKGCSFQPDERKSIVDAIAGTM